MSICDLEDKFDTFSFDDKLLELKRKITKENIDQLMIEYNKEILPKYIKTKIMTEVNLKGFLFEDILNKIKTDIMYASYFSKSALKQNIAEKLQFQYLTNKYPNLKKLPSNGPNSFFLSNKGIVKKRPEKGTKSIDFYDPDNKTFYYAKYINENGGSQDNQFIDVKTFVELSNIFCRKDNTFKFILLIDGKYFNDKKKEILNDMIDIKNIYNIYVKTSQLNF